MKKVLILSLAMLISIGCNSAAQQANVPNNTNIAIVKTNSSAIVSSHSDEAGKTAAPPSDKPASSSTESPMARPIDVAEMTADIEQAEKQYRKNQKDEKAKDELAKAYFIRATALTDAAQYRAALGDYRKGLKLNPTDEDARKMHDQILSIFKSIGREPPKEGEEPAPLPFKK
ncbi:MAG: tetratricopeptide repeat protein [Acidobacteriota bacterium]|nr:tetratricopeptide repeat protein [Acidobacteriota bacterium]